jgi:hypothetical protein
MKKVEQQVNQNRANFNSKKRTESCFGQQAYSGATKTCSCTNLGRKFKEINLLTLTGFNLIQC